MADAPAPTPAEVQFNTSSAHPTPPGYQAWAIRNDYPPPKPPTAPYVPEGPPLGVPDAPWLDIDFEANAEMYAAIVKQYCFDGMVNNDFVAQKNTIRDWYHAPWMHYGNNGREPLHGLTFERPTPPREFSATATRYLQAWAIGFYNSAGASVFGGVWANPNDPQWTDHLKFPLGTCVYKLLLTNATDEEYPSQVGSPAWNAVIAVQPAGEGMPRGNIRDSTPSPVRVFQMDFATRDDRAPTGWVFGTFMYDGASGQGWDGLIPVGLQWGNDPDLTQEAFEQGQKAQELWINPAADKARISLHGGRPSWGWNGRMNGPADNFISACASCHSAAQSIPAGLTPSPAPVKDAQGNWIPRDPETMKWFRNIPAGQPFTEGALSADYSLQFMVGFNNYKSWLALQQDPTLSHTAPERKAAFQLPLRSGPLMQY